MEVSQSYSLHEFNLLLCFCLMWIEAYGSAVYLNYGKVITDTQTHTHTSQGVQYFGNDQPVYEWII